MAPERTPSRQSSDGPMHRRLTRDLLTFEWTQLQPRAALLCLPALAVPLAIGVGTGHVRQGMMTAAGAFSVGFGSYQQFGSSRKLPMLVAASGMCVSSWIGTLGGLVPTVAVLLTALGGMSYALAWRRGPGASWVALQCLIWLIISTAFPASGLRALTRGSFVLAGGLLQMAIITTAWRLTGHVPAAAIGTTRAAEPALVARSPGARRWGHAVRVAVAMAMAMAVGQALPVANGYWIPMTTAIVTRPELHHTYQRGAARIVGTLVGAALATLIAWALHPLPSLLSALVVVFAAACYLLVYVNYAAFAVCLTSYVVFLLALAGAAEAATIAHRAVNTLIGGALGGLAHASFAGGARIIQRLRAPAGVVPRA